MTRGACNKAYYPVALQSNGVHYAVMAVRRARRCAVHYAVMAVRRAACGARSKGGALRSNGRRCGGGALRSPLRLQFASTFFLYIKKIFITHLVKLFTLCTLPRNLKCILGDL